MPNSKKKVATFFNRHPNGVVDKRTDLYYMESDDNGETWTTVDHQPLLTPVVDFDSPSRVINYAISNKNIYLKDMIFDPEGNPICLYIRSNGHTLVLTAVHMSGVLPFGRERNG